MPTPRLQPGSVRGSGLQDITKAPPSHRCRSSTGSACVDEEIVGVDRLGGPFSHFSHLYRAGPGAYKTAQALVGDCTSSTEWSAQEAACGPPPARWKSILSAVTRRDAIATARGHWWCQPASGSVTAKQALDSPLIRGGNARAFSSSCEHHHRVQAEDFSAPKMPPTCRARLRNRLHHQRASRMPSPAPP